MHRSLADEKPFEPTRTDRTQEGHVAFLAFVPSEIEEGDFDKKCWPRLMGFPFSIVYSSSRQSTDARFAMVSALYEPDVESFREARTERELAYLNKLGGADHVRVVLKKGGGMETFKYRGERLVAGAHGKNFNSTMAQTTMIGIQDDEPVELTNY